MRNFGTFTTRLFDEVFSDFDRYFVDAPVTKSKEKTDIVSTITDSEKTETYKNGRLHNETGPAVVYKDKSKGSEYWLNGRQVTKEDVDVLISKAEENKKRVITIDGKDYVITEKQWKEIKAKIGEVIKL